MIDRVENVGDAAEDIAEIERHCFSTPWTSEQVRQSDDRTVFFLAKIDGQAVGYGGMYTVLDEGYVTNIGVLPAFRRKGIGRKIVLSLIDYSLQNRLSFLSLEVRPSNDAAISLYRSLGFRAVGTRKNFYHKPQEDAIIMTRYFEDERAVDSGN